MPAFMKGLSFLTGVLLLASCTQIATVKQATPRFAVVGTQDQQLASAEQQLREAQKLEGSDPLRALGNYLASAQLAFDQLRRRPANKRARDVYNFSVARSIDVIESAGLNPWDRLLTVPAPTGQYSLTTIRHAGPDRNPADYQLIPADSVVIGGTYFARRIVLEGVGAPVVAIGREEKKDFRKTFTSRRLYGSATAIVRFNDHRAQLEFMEPFATERISLRGHTYPLAADFTAAVAVALTRERPEKLGLARLLRPKSTPTPRDSRDCRCTIRIAFP